MMLQRIRKNSLISRHRITPIWRRRPLIDGELVKNVVIKGVMI